MLTGRFERIGARMTCRFALAIVGILFPVRTVTAQAIVSSPVHVVPPTVGALVTPLFPSGAYRLTLTVPPSVGAPSITRHMRGTLAHAGSAITMQLERSLLLRGTLDGSRLTLAAADARGDTLAFVLTATANHAVGTVAVASNARRTTGTATLEPVTTTGAHGGGAASARNRDDDNTCANVVLCLIRDLFGIIIDVNDR